jgi:hypothetical protein
MELVTVNSLVASVDHEQSQVTPLHSKYSPDSAFYFDGVYAPALAPCKRLSRARNNGLTVRRTSREGSCVRNGPNE